MKIIDLTPAYKKAVLRQNNLAAYKKSYPALFAHYFKYWADQRLFKKSLTAEEVDRRANLIKSRLKFIEKKFAAAGFNLKNQKMILFVGQNTTNGHAFYGKGEFIVWLPVESYISRQRIDIFVTHEIIHALHYSQNPAFYFKNNAQRLRIGSSLMIEGLATFLTMKILKINAGQALWADYISAKEAKLWLEQCQQRKNEMLKFVLKNFNLSDQKIELFGGTNPRDVFRSRGGYWLGLQIIQQIARKYPIKKLLKIPKKDFESLIKKTASF
jgi:hypothetical protein